MNIPLRTAFTAAALVATLLVQTLVPLTVSAANDKATYFGGTIPEFKDAKHPVEGRLQTTDETSLKFVYQKEQTVGIPYANFIDIEYGQKSGRRVGAAVASTILLVPHRFIVPDVQETKTLRDNWIQGRRRKRTGRRFPGRQRRSPNPLTDPRSTFGQEGLLPGQER